MAGANMSGDLKDPSVAIPKGTLGAIGLTYVSYVGLVLIIGLSCLRCADVAGEEFCNNFESVAESDAPEGTGGLIYNKLIMTSMSIWAPLLYVGVFAATLSSALASLVGAPRILQSVASDKIFPWAAFNYFGEGRGPNNEPVRAYFLTFTICCCCVAIGKLDAIAPIISNFFMISYAFTNYACFASSMARYPGWRPSFRYYNKWLSLFGFVLCIVVMFLMDYITSFVTVFLAAALYSYLVWLDPNVNWGAAGSARKYAITLQGMEQLQNNAQDHVKTYRPQFLVMCGQPQKRSQLVKFVSLLSKGGGIMLCADVIRASEIELPEEKQNVNRVRKDGEIQLEAISESPTESTTTASTDGSSSTRSESNASASSSFAADHGSSSHTELATRLAARLASVKRRRAHGDKFLGNKKIWGGKRCPGAFFDSVVGENLLDGFQSLLQISGVGRMRPNCVVLGFKSDWQDASMSDIKEYEQIIRITLASELGIIILRDDKKVFEIDFNLHRRPLSKMLSGRSVISRPASASDASCTTQGSSSELGADDCRLNMPSPSKPLQSQPSSSPVKMSGSTIDVWWVSDDGGLTMLIPHLMTQHRALRKGQRLRVLTVTNYNLEETSKLQKTEFRMVHLLKKFRIDAQVEAVEANLSSRAKDETIAEFDALRNVDKSLLTQEEKVKTNRVLRLAEEVRARTTSDTSSVFITLPVPETGFPVGLYASWLHMLSTGLPPTILMRGNQSNVLTFVC